MGAPITEDAGFTWRDYVDGLVRAEGSLTAVAEKLARDKNFADDVGSVERALRRLRDRGRQTGIWSARCGRCAPPLDGELPLSIQRSAGSGV
jgi:hypothetical protein